jgi:hypothetical protein
LSRLFEPVKSKISGSYEIMFVTSISCIYSSKLTPYVVFEAQN